MVLFIDQKISKGYQYPRMVYIKYRFSEDLFSDTLFEGELVKDIHGDWCFYIYNLLILRGTKQDKVKLPYKIKNMYSILTNNYTEDGYLECCPLRVKKFFSYSKMNEYISKFIVSLPYTCNGIYFHSVFANKNNVLFLYEFRAGRQKIVDRDISAIPPNIETLLKSPIVSISKQKVVKMEKLDILDISENTKYRIFEIHKTSNPGVYDLYCLKNGKNKKYSIARIPNLKTSNMIKKFLENKEKEIISCSYNERFKKWIPIEKSISKISLFTDVRSIET